MNATTASALGRPFHVGALYSSYTGDVLASGQWNPVKIEDITKSAAISSEKTKLFQNGNLSDKAKMLSMSSAEKLSALINLIPMMGSAQIFNDDDAIKCSDMAGIILKLEFRSEAKYCNIPELKKFLDFTNISKQATHVVTRVEFGWDAYFVFEKKIEDGMSLRQTRNKLECVVSKLASDPKDDNDALDDFVDGISCKYFADSEINQDPPTRFLEAVEMIKLLLSKPPRSIPKLATLYPLDKLGGSVVFGNVETALVDRVEQLCVNYRSVKAEMELFETNDIIDWAKDEIHLFKHLLESVTAKFLKLHISLVPEIRKLAKPVSDLVKLIEKFEDSSFSPENFQRCLKTTCSTSSVLNDFVKTAKKKSIPFLVGNQIEAFFKNLGDNEVVVAFAFKSPVLASRNLQDLKNNVFLTRFIKPSEIDEWNSDPQSLEEMKKSFHLFLQYRELNLSSPIKYVVIDDESDDALTNPSTVITYIRGSKSEIKLLSQPPAPIPTGAKGIDWVELMLEPPEGDLNVGLELLITYCENGQRGKRAQQTFKLEDQVQVKGLLPGKNYIFQIQVRSNAGLSPPSSWSDGIATEKDVPLAQKILQECVKVVDANSEIEIFTPKSKDEAFIGDGLRIVQVGEAGAHYHYRERTIMVLGATGVGKTTFLNSMANYVANVRENDPFRLKIVTEIEEGKASSQSKTKMVSAYCFNNTKLPYKLVVIDTPGFGDTEGLAADKRTTGLVKNLFENKDGNGIDRLDAVCVVVKASDSKLDAQQRHNFNSVFQLFGKDIVKNIFIVATYCDASDPPVIASLKDANIDYSKFFKFNNSAFFEGVKTTRLEQMSQQFYWKVGIESFDNFFHELEKTFPASLALSFEVLQHRQQLETLVMDLHKNVKIGLGKLEEMRQEMQVMEKFEAKIKANKSFTYTIRQEKVVHEDISGRGIHTTTCMTCNFTCHSNCAFADNADKAKCVAMSPTGDCKVCPRKCIWNLHKNTPYICKIIEEVVTKTDEDLRSKYLKATDNKKTKEAMLQNLGQMFGKQQKDILETVTNIRKTIQELQEIAHRPTYMTDVEYIDTLITSEKSEHKPGWSQRVKHLEDQKDLAVLIEQAQDPNFNPFEEYEEEESGWLTFAKEKFWRFVSF